MNDCQYDLALREMDLTNKNALAIYHFVQDQVQYLGMEGAFGPLPLSAITEALTVLDVDRDEWLHYIDRVRVLHQSFCSIHNKKKDGRGKAAPTGRDDGASSTMNVPFAQKAAKK